MSADVNVRSEYRAGFFLSAGECNAQSVMPLPLLVQRIIEVATLHANSLGIGYSRLCGFNMAWVLSRASIEMTRYPGINENYSLTTWIESANRHFSERNVEIADGDGVVIGYARTLWVAIDVANRRGADMSPLLPGLPLSDRECPIARQPKLRAVTDSDSVRNHRFSYCDIDFNRHVNSTRYVETILNNWSVDFFDSNVVKRFDIAYLSEIHYNDEVTVATKADGNCCEVEFVNGGVPCTRARILFEPRI